MFGNLINKKPEKSPIVKVGWLITDSVGPEFMWPEPRPVKTDSVMGESPHAVNRCPAIVDHEARLFEVTCPFDLMIALRRGENGRPEIVRADGGKGMLGTGLIRKLTVLMGEKEWRHPHRPVIQLRTPYRFISDDLVYINQLPPMLSYKANQWPGIMIGGRFPIDAWPRTLMWAFEWFEPKKPLLLKRGDPLFYCRFETTDPSKKIRLVEAEETPELKKQMSGVDGIANYVQQTFSLFSTARARRPKQLLVERKKD